MLSPIRPTSLKQTSQGFTLIEAMIVISILVILAAIALPNFRDMIIRNQVANTTNEFVGALQATRALAISNNSCASLCTIQSAPPNATCTSSGSNSNFVNQGWMVVRHEDCALATSGGVLAVDDVQSIKNGQANGYSLRSNSANIVTFNARGNLLPPANQTTFTFTVTPPTGTPSSFNRFICVNRMGRISARTTNTCI